MKFLTFASLALAVALTSAFVIPGKDKRAPIVAVGTDFDETDALTKRAPLVAVGVDFDETGAATKRDAAEVDEKRSYKDGT